MGKLLASIVVPTLNEGQFIEQCLKALLNQSIPKNKYEIIVSDSSSTDGTVKIARKYADKIVVCKKHSAGFGRNFGARHAAGKYLGFVDADTVVSDKWVEGLLEGLEKGIGCTGPIEVLEKNSLKTALFYRWWSLQSRLSVALHYPIFPGFNIGARRDYFEKAGMFSMHDMTTEDIELGLKLKKFGEIVFSKKMHVKTSARRLASTPLRAYIWNGVNFAIFKKSRKWREHRHDF